MRQAADGQVPPNEVLQKIIKLEQQVTLISHQVREAASHDKCSAEIASLKQEIA